MGEWSVFVGNTSFGKGYENLEDAVEDGMNLLAQYIGKPIKFTTQGWEIKYVKK